MPSTIAVASLSGFMWEVFTWFGEFSLIIGGLAICLFVGYRWGLKPAIEETKREVPKVDFK